jgi:hypothetical protein
VKLAFNEDCLRDEALLGQPLIITEGEFDALAAIQSGFAKTISVPDGAPPPGERTAEDLEGGKKYDWLFDQIGLFAKDQVPEIIIAADGDENGAAMLQDLSVIFGRYRCKFLTYPKARKDRGRERCKDLNEVLEDYGAKGVVETLNRAQWLRVDGVYRMSELPPLPAGDLRAAPPICSRELQGPPGRLLRGHRHARLRQDQLRQRRVLRHRPGQRPDDRLGVVRAGAAARPPAQSAGLVLRPCRSTALRPTRSPPPTGGSTPTTCS